YALGGHRNLLGMKAEEARGLTPVETRLTTPGPYRNVDLDSGQLPSNLQATLLPEESETLKDVAVSVNGRIAATTEAWNFFGTWMVGVNLPTASFRQGENTIEVFSIRED
ncbi:MAG: hypothetical protein M3Y45_01195, partial [Actinomycetota bacterium]|nr:hypothetical protein [Actinomycetota bacterium]